MKRRLQGIPGLLEKNPIGNIAKSRKTSRETIVKNKSEIKKELWARPSWDLEAASLPSFQIVSSASVIPLRVGSWNRQRKLDCGAA